jgi:hypothetical protein
MSIDIEHPVSDSPESSDGEGLTAGDLEELNVISQASMKFLAVSRESEIIFGESTANALADLALSREGLVCDITWEIERNVN